MTRNSGVAQHLRAAAAVSRSRRTTVPCSILPASRSPVSTKSWAARRTADGIGRFYSDQTAASETVEMDLQRRARGAQSPADKQRRRDGAATCRHRYPPKPWLGGRWCGDLRLRFGRLAGLHAINAFGPGLLRYQCQAELLAHHASKEATDRVRLPTGRLHDGSDRCTLGLSKSRLRRLFRTATPTLIAGA